MQERCPQIPPPLTDSDAVGHRRPDQKGFGAAGPPFCLQGQRRAGVCLARSAGVCLVWCQTRAGHGDVPQTPGSKTETCLFFPCVGLFASGCGLQQRRFCFLCASFVGNPKSDVATEKRTSYRARDRSGCRGFLALRTRLSRGQPCSWGKSHGAPGPATPPAVAKPSRSFSGQTDESPKQIPSQGEILPVQICPSDHGGRPTPATLIVCPYVPTPE